MGEYHRVELGLEIDWTMLHALAEVVHVQVLESGTGDEYYHIFLRERG